MLDLKQRFAQCHPRKVLAEECTIVSLTIQLNADVFHSTTVDVVATRTISSRSLNANKLVEMFKKCSTIFDFHIFFYFLNFFQKLILSLLSLESIFGLGVLIKNNVFQPFSIIFESKGRPTQKILSIFRFHLSQSGVHNQFRNLNSNIYLGFGWK